MFTDQRNSLHGIVPGIGAAHTGHPCWSLGNRHARRIAGKTASRCAEKITTRWMKGRLIAVARWHAAHAARHATCAPPFYLPACPA
ncbi:hypothetical protein P355_3096 [Burkholderia cenocepacia KC-01]|nr:hypothetical protein P355_3096 [Burkholderia cenocepacia KC-01]